MERDDDSSSFQYQLHHSSLCRSNGKELKSDKSGRSTMGKLASTARYNGVFDLARSSDKMATSLHFHAKVDVSVHILINGFHGNRVD